VTHECDRQTDGQILPQQVPLSPGADKHLDHGKDAYTRGAVWWLYAHDDNDDNTQTAVKISLHYIAKRIRYIHICTTKR